VFKLSDFGKIIFNSVKKSPISKKKNSLKVNVATT